MRDGGHTLVHHKHTENQGYDATIGKTDNFLHKCHFTLIMGTFRGNKNIRSKMYSLNIGNIGPQESYLSVLSLSFPI